MVSRGQIRKTLYGSVSGMALLLAATPAVLAADDSDPQIDPQAMQQLQARVAAIKARVKALQADQAAQPQTDPSDTAATVALEPPAPSKAVSSHLESIALQGHAGPADAVVGGDFPGSFKLPGSDTSISIRGQVKADFIYDFNEQVGDSFVSTLIAPKGVFFAPGGADVNRGGFVRMIARDTRVTFETRTPTSYGDLKTFIDTDFYGADNFAGPGNEGGLAGGGFGNAFVTNSFTMRVRQAYGQLGPVLVGQTWSTFMNDIGGADTLDFYGPTGIAFGPSDDAALQPELGQVERRGGAGESAEPAVQRSRGWRGQLWLECAQRAACARRHRPVGI